MSQSNQYVGLDVSLKETSICVIDDADKIVWRGRVDSMRAVIARYQGRSEVVFQKAIRCALARCDVAEAEIAREANDRASAAAAHMRAMIADPGWRTGRALASDVVATVVAPFRAMAAPR